MYFSEIQSQIDRVNRMLKQKVEHEAKPMAYKIVEGPNEKEFPNAETNSDLDLLDIDDLARNLLIHTYHIKDRIAANSNSKSLIESEISTDETLAICADLANWAKHGELNKSRSGKFPYVQGSRTLHKEFVQDTKSGQWSATISEVFANVCDKDGKYLGDAFEIVEYTLKRFQSITEDTEI